LTVPTVPRKADLKKQDRVITWKVTSSRKIFGAYGDIASVKVLSTPEADMDAVHTTAALVLSSPEEMRT